MSKPTCGTVHPETGLACFFRANHDPAEHGCPANQLEYGMKFDDGGTTDYCFGENIFLFWPVAEDQP